MNTEFCEQHLVEGFLSKYTDAAGSCWKQQQ